MKVAAFKKIALATVLMLAPAALFAQSGQEIQHRKFEQQARIHQGERDGQLTHREGYRLERQEHRIDREERGMRYRDGGHLTRVDRRVIDRRQNREIRRIHRDRQYR
jgi:hypothetical protein